MRLNGRNGFALFLMVCGLLILLNMFGLGLGNMIGLIIPVALMGLGYIGIKKGRPVIGWILVIVGLFGLLGKISGLFGLIIAGVLLYFGYTLLKRPSGNV